MTENKVILVPSPIIDKKEEALLEKLTERYEKLLKPGALAKTKSKVAERIPQMVKDMGSEAKDMMTESELYGACMEIVVKGFDVLEKNAAKLSIPEKYIIGKLNDASEDVNINSIDEICLAREYDIAKLVNRYKTQDKALALIEGGATGAPGLAGLPFNIVLSTFLYYRGVQSIAMHYGYDVKNNSDELIIASEVFMNALNPVEDGTGIVGKIMTMAEGATVRHLAKKSWTDMAMEGGIPLLIVKLRALAHKSAAKALERAGEKGLERSVFSHVFEQIGRQLTQKAIGRAIPVISAGISALFDLAQMDKVLEYADIFYSRRFLVEKEARINTLLGYDSGDISEVIDVSDDELDIDSESDISDIEE